MKTKKLKLSEEMLIRALRERHPAGPKALYDMYSGSLFGVICRILNDQALSEDILQETFLKIWRSIDHYEPEKGRLFTWMVNIARHQAIDRVRSKNYRNGQQTQGLEGCEDLALPAEGIYDRADRYFIRLGVEKLRSQESEVINLIYYQGYTHAEAAAALGLPLGTVKTRLMMGLKRLRSFYTAGHLSVAS